MKKHLSFAISGLVFLMVGELLARDVEKTEKIEKSLRFGDVKGKNRLIVDNVFGSVQVTGYDGDEVLVKAVKTIHAKSEDDVEEAREEVYLDITHEEDMIELYVDGPFRDSGHHRSRRWRGYRHSGWEVHFDFEIKVPKSTLLEVKTVNDGEISVSRIESDYEVRNVNGGISMEQIGGSGEVYTVNGDVTVDFTKNPERDSRFGSLNGEVKLYFLPNLSADFRLKTFNGEIYSDFPVDYVPAKAMTVSENKKGKYVYKTGRTTTVRAGKGGPEIELDGFNGDMFILKKK
jgi:hypothetical protein